MNLDVLVQLYFPGCACRLSRTTNQTSFFCRTAFACFLELHDVFNKFVENVNEFGCLWKEFEEFLEMDDEFEHVEFIQQYGTFEM